MLVPGGVLVAEPRCWWLAMRRDWKRRIVYLACQGVSRLQGVHDALRIYTKSFVLAIMGNICKERGKNIMKRYRLWQQSVLHGLNVVVGITSGHDNAATLARMSNLPPPHVRYSLVQNPTSQHRKDVRQRPRPKPVTES